MSKNVILVYRGKEIFIKMWNYCYKYVLVLNNYSIAVILA